MKKRLSFSQQLSSLLWSNSNLQLLMCHPRANALTQYLVNGAIMVDHQASQITRQCGMSISKRSTLTGDKNLLLDVNVIVDTWLGLGPEEITEKIFDLSRVGHVKLWLTNAALVRL